MWDDGRDVPRIRAGATSSKGNPAVELRDYITVLRKGWAFIVVMVLVGVGPLPPTRS
jgi:hypothetical protein